MKQFLEKKEKGFFCSAASIVLFAIGLVFYRMLTAVSFETTERSIVVVLAAFAAILFSLIASYKDFGKVPSILAYAASTVAFFTLLEGRASYLAFLWLPITPEKVVTIPIAIWFVRKLFPNDFETIKKIKELN